MRTALYRVTLDVPTALGKSDSCLFASRTASSTPAGTFSLRRRAPLFTSRPIWLAQSSTVLSSCISVRSAISMFHPATATPCRVNCCSKKFCAASFASRANTVPFANRLPLGVRPVLRRWLCYGDFTMIWAAFTLAFFGFLRCSEFTYPGVATCRPEFDLTTDCLKFYPSIAAPERGHFYAQVVQN